jgi:4-hydroxy-2-oxoglutarate aldolase
MSLELHGIFGPVVTTFYQTNGDVDVAAFAANVRAHVAAGLHGILVTGSTGEAALLTADERSMLVDAARELVPQDKVLLVGTGAESTRACVALTKDAAARGADAVLVVAPHYFGPVMTPAALRAHYERVADKSPVPVVLYNIPKYMHFALAPSLVEQLAQHENIVGIKDSSGNKDLLSSYITIQSDSFSVLTGSAQLAQFALESGARGGILAVSLFAASLTMEAWSAVERGDTPAATAAQGALTPLASKIVGEMGIAGIKAAMDRVGLHGGPVRSPLLPLDAQQSEVVDELLRTAIGVTTG